MTLDEIKIIAALHGFGVLCLYNGTTIVYATCEDGRVDSINFDSEMQPNTLAIGTSAAYCTVPTEKLMAGDFPQTPLSVLWNSKNDAG